jgi:hypothetical protein
MQARHETRSHERVAPSDHGFVPENLSRYLLDFRLFSPYRVTVRGAVLSSRSIIDREEIEPLRGRNRRARGAVARGKRAGEIIGGPFALTDEGKAADH